MIKTFRKYRAIIDWIDTEKNSFESRETVFNLFSITDWTSVNNDHAGFNDKYKRTAICINDGPSFRIRVSFDEFDAVMTKFLHEYGLMDEGSMPGKEKKPAKQTYQGMMHYKFHKFPDKIVCNSYPAGVDPPDFETAMANVLHSQITPYN